MEYTSLSEKVLIHPEQVSEEMPYTDQRRVREALEALGYERVHFDRRILKKLYPLCRSGQGEYTLSLVHTGDRIEITDIENGDTREQHYGLAVDYGSTTIVFQLLNLCTGETIFQCRETNSQRCYGTDILTRIIYGLGGEEKRRDLHNVTVDTFHRGFLNILTHTGIDPADCPCMVISGNTTMIHFLLELDAWTVFSSPYAPVVTEPGFFSGPELDLEFPGQVYIIPSASNYIGGDIVSGLLTIDLQEREEISAFFDVGTNGELVMGNKDWLMAGAGAAGPALEGYISKYGMIAGPGAIDRVKIQGKELTYTTIDDEKPVGICGSGIIDLLAEMRLNGWVDITGKLNPDASDRIVPVPAAGEEEGANIMTDGSGRKENRKSDKSNSDGPKSGREMEHSAGKSDSSVREQEDSLEAGMEYGAVYAWGSESGTGKDLYFSQTDILQYIETKAAAHTMVDCLLDFAGLSIEDVSRMYLSGAFCNHADLESAITIGMFPDLPRDAYVPLPNSSLEGARTLLLNRGKLQEIRKILDTIYCVQLASAPDFTIRMNSSKFIPHTDMRLYPSVEKRLAERGLQ
ncbi:MAG: ASKHA domain-containing protein [Lachnospiraceae bacterium]|nr:ASKHA domain-containing protein [Lachnospiraceae bacterium]